MPETKRSSPLPILGYIFLFLVGSLDTVLKYFGPLGVAAYLLIGAFVIFLAYRFVVPALFSISERTANILSFLLLICIIIAAVVIYPIANVQTVNGGSDADDALIVAGRELSNGRYPYYPATYLNNPISPMPGAVILALPFVLTNTIVLQTIFWLVALFFLIRHIFGTSKAALGLIAALLFLSPTVLQNIVTSSDYVSNSIYVLIGMWLLVHYASVRESSEWKRYAIAIVLGVFLSSRSNFLLLMPLLFSILGQNAGWWNAFKYLSVSGIILLLITVPFWFYDPPRFAPLIVQAGKIRNFETLLPYAGVIVPAIGFGTAAILSLQRLEPDSRKFFRNCAVVQVFVLLIMSTLYSIKLGRLDFFIGQSGYGMFTLFFGSLAGWMTFAPISKDNVTTSCLT